VKRRLFLSTHCLTQNATQRLAIRILELCRRVAAGVQRNPGLYRPALTVSKVQPHVSGVELSVTHLKCLLECTYQFKRKVLYGLDGLPGGAMGSGKGLHDALEELAMLTIRSGRIRISR
jgi:hypothetical protein